SLAFCSPMLEAHRSDRVADTGDHGWPDPHEPLVDDLQRLDGDFVGLGVESWPLQLLRQAILEKPKCDPQLVHARQHHRRRTAGPPVAAVMPEPRSERRMKPFFRKGALLP